MNPVAGGSKRRAVLQIGRRINRMEDGSPSAMVEVSDSATPLLSYKMRTMCIM
jgi:hypothetical protein